MARSPSKKKKKMKIIVFKRLSIKDTFYYQQDRISMLILNLSPCEFFDFSFKCGRSRGSNSMSLSSNQAPWIWSWKIAWRMHMTLFISLIKILNFLRAPKKALRKFFFLKWGAKDSKWLNSPRSKILYFYFFPKRLIKMLCRASGT